MIIINTRKLKNKENLDADKQAYLSLWNYGNY